MLKLCDKSIVKPLPIIFKNCKLKKTFPNIWKKASVVPIHKKQEKDLTNELLNPNQSGFRPFDSCVNQLLSINHDIFSNFDCDQPKDIHAVFLDISKAFDKIWLSGFIFKVKSSGISGDFLKLSKNFLSKRFQRVVLNGQRSEWKTINAGVPQGSILGLVFFLIYINDLTDGISSIVKLFAMRHHSFQLLKIRIIHHHSLTMILIKLVIGPVHGKFF